MSRRHRLIRLSDIYGAIETFETRRGELMAQLSDIESGDPGDGYWARHQTALEAIAFNQRCLEGARECARYAEGLCRA